MAWVKSVSIDGLAGRSRPLQIEFQRDVNVLWGVNGCGKTSLLRVIHSALLNEPSILSNTPFRTATVVFEYELDGITYTRTYERPGRPHSRKVRQLDELENPEDLALYEDVSYQETLKQKKLPISWKTTPRWDRALSHVAHRFLPISRVASDSRAGLRSYAAPDIGQILDEEAIDRMFATELQRLWRDYSIREAQRISDIQREGIAEILNSILERSRPDLDVLLPEKSIESTYSILRGFFRSQRIPFELGSERQFANSYKNNETLRRVAHKVVDIQSKTLDISAPRRRAATLLAELFTGNKQLRLGPRQVEVLIQDVRVPVQHLSSGEKQLLRMLIECLAVGNNCILIDEPELSMHVDWQNRLINAMRSVNPDLQIIAATHSPEVMAEISDDCIFEMVL